MQIKVTVLYFGAAREIAKASEKEFEFENNISAADGFAQILNANPLLLEKFGKSLLFAVNQNYAAGDEILREGDELAVFPPVSGG